MEIKITFTGESVYDLEVQMQMFLANIGTMRNAMDPAPEKEETETEQVEETTEQVEEETTGTEETEEDPNPGKKAFDASETRRKAISKLMILYNEGGDVQKAVKELLKAFDVKKFSEVPDEKVDDLIKAANRIEAKKAAA